MVRLGIWVLAVLLGALATGGALAASDPHPLRPPEMDSPRATIQSVFSEVEHAFAARREGDPRRLEDILRGRAIYLLDLDDEPPQLRTEIGVESILMFYEILSRIEQPPLSDIPGREEVERDDIKSWLIPNSTLLVTRTDEDLGLPRFRLSDGSLKQLRNDYALIKELPKRAGSVWFDTYEAFRQGVGPLLGRAIDEHHIASAPAWWRTEILLVPVWKLCVLVLFHVVALLIAAAVFLLLHRWKQARPDGTAPLASLLILSATLMGLIAALQQLVGYELQITGPLLRVLEVVWTAVFTGGAVMFAFGVLRLSTELFVRIAKLRDRPADEHIIRLVFRALGLVVAIGLLVVAAQRLGIPVSGIVTGLGVGGIAVALAAQGTLQNLLGGAMLLADRPLRVGDFCRYGDRIGTLEAIGLRSSRLRSLDRTLVTVPNSDLAAMHVENYRHRDRILMQTSFGLRYETRPDQLRCILADIRAMLIAHPKVLNEPARVRFVGFGQSSLDIEIFAYVRTTDFNEFAAIREDLLLRIFDIVARAGGSFAFPSQTVYLRRDGNGDPNAVEAAEAKVAQWRRIGMLPFPEFDTGQRGELTDTLPYPPEGSPHARTQDTLQPSSVVP